MHFPRFVPGSSQILIRPAVPEDIPRLEAHLTRRMPGTHGDRVAMQGRGVAVYLIACEGALPVGHVLVEWDASPPTVFPPYPILSDIAVHPGHQSRGIGSQLMAQAEDLAAQRAYRQVGLDVAVDNLRARALYERRGYRDSGLGTRGHRWAFLDDVGQEHRQQETCLHLVKRLG